MKERVFQKRVKKCVNQMVAQNLTIKDEWFIMEFATKKGIWVNPMNDDYINFEAAVDEGLKKKRSPNAETVAAIEEARNGGGTTYDSFEDAMSDIDKEIAEDKLKANNWWSEFCAAKKVAKDTNKIVVLVGSIKETFYNAEIRTWEREDISLCLEMENYHIGWC